MVSYLASGSADNTVRLWNLENEEVALLSGHSQAITSLTWNPNSKRIASGSSDGTIRLWDVGE